MTAPDRRRRVVLLTGPSGCGKSKLARDSGMPVLNLDDFYRDGDDPALPLLPGLGIVDWDDPRAWNAEAAIATLEQICRTGSADVPVYDIASDRATSSRRFDVGASTAYVAEGIFAAEIIRDCRALGIVADAIVVQRRPWKNFLRRLVRDLSERRKPPLTLLRRGWSLKRREREVVARQVAMGATPCDAPTTARRLALLASPPARPPHRESDC